MLVNNSSSEAYLLISRDRACAARLHTLMSQTERTPTYDDVDYAVDSPHVIITLRKIMKLAYSKKFMKLGVVHTSTIMSVIVS
jgi:hypothetical protein